MYDLERILAVVNGAESEKRLEAMAACEAALKAELDSGRTDWGSLVAWLLPTLLAALGERNKGVQVHAANCLQLLAHQSEAVERSLREAMSGPDDWTAWGAAIVMARLGLWCPEIAGALSGAFGADDKDVRWAAADFSVRLGRNHPEAVAMAVAALTSESRVVRKMAAYCLGTMSAYADVEIPLASRLCDPDRDVRRAAIIALSRLSRRSPQTSAHIGALADDPDEFVRRLAAFVAR